MGKEKIFWADGDNPKMIAAFEMAQKTFKYFWREYTWESRRLIPALNAAYVKVACKQIVGDDNPIVEHMWINEVYFDGNHVKGVLVNNPKALTNYKIGDVIKVPLAQISDWMFCITEQNSKGLFAKVFSSKQKPKTYGGFTIQAMRSDMTDEQRRSHDKAWGFDFGDYNDILIVHGQKEYPENLVEHPMSKNMKEKFVAFLNANPSEMYVVDDQRMTFLHKETVAGNLSSVEVLLSLGVDKSMKSATGETALDYANRLGWDHIAQVLI